MKCRVDQQVLKKYLMKWSEAVPIEALHSLNSQYENCVVIPTFDESMKMLQRIANWQNTLTILVINSPDNASHDAHERTAEAYRSFEKQAQVSGKGWSIQYTPFNSAHIALWTPHLPAREGVGLARKIGFDIALHAFFHEKITSPWIHSTDADVQWPDHWLTYHSTVTTKVGAALLPFVHKASAPMWHTATMVYDAKLRYYVAGLKHANSPWAFHTLGSTLVVNIDAYTKVRGMPKRNAGEDFHLLRKIAKIAPVIDIKGTPLTLSGRPSDRVPFGTGPSIIQYTNQSSAFHHPIFYHPKSFEHLKRFQHALLENGPSSSITRTLMDQWEIDKWKQSLNPSQQNDPRMMRQFFDSLKTLRTIHNLHSSLALPYLSAAQLMRENPSWLPKTLGVALKTLEAEYS